MKGITLNEIHVWDLRVGADVLRFFNIRRVSELKYHPNLMSVYIKYTDGLSEVLANSTPIQIFLGDESLEEKKFLYDLEIQRSTFLTMAGFPNETILPPHLTDLLDAYCAAYKKMYLEKWGVKGPNGAVLRQEEPYETAAREAWEKGVSDYWKITDKKDDDTLEISFE